MSSSPGFCIVDADATHAALPFAALLQALQQGFADGCEAPPRQVLELADPTGGASMTSLVMPAWVPGRYYGLKCINIAPANAARGLPGLHASYLLHDARTGVPLALIDGDALTARRTAATSALAARFLARDDAAELLVVGAGRIAALLPDAFRAARPGLRRFRIWARRHEQAQTLARAWCAQGLDAAAVSDLPAAASTADIVSCATLATAPVVHGAWLRPGTHLDLIGSFTPAMREADDACWNGALWCVDTEEALLKSGELLQPMASGALRADSLHGTLAQLCRGERVGRTRVDPRTVFKSVGHALEDLAAGMLVMDTLRASEGARPPSSDPRTR